MSDATHAQRRNLETATLRVVSCSGVSLHGCRRLFPCGEWARRRPRVVEIRLNMMIHHVSAEYVMRGIKFANDSNADAVLLELNTPGGLETSMRDIISAILNSRVPVITYVAPSGASAASAGFFILEAGDLAVMAPGTNSGAAHPVMLGGADVGKTMEAKIENDAAAYMRSIAGQARPQFDPGGGRGSQELVLLG